MKCVACRKDEPTVTDAEIAEFQPQASDWEIVELDGIKRLRPVFSFDFVQALEFTNKVGVLAEDEGHHPALLTEWGRTTVTWWTRAADRRAHACRPPTRGNWARPDQG